MNIIKKRWAKYYQRQNKNRYWHLSIDLILIAVVLMLIGINIYFSAWQSALVLGIDDTATTSPAGPIATSTSDNVKPEYQPINLSLKLNSPQTIVAPDETVTYLISYQNDSDIDLEQIKINLLANLNLVNNQPEITLDRIPAGSGGKLDFTITIKSSFAIKPTNGLWLESFAQASLNHPQQPKQQITINSNKLAQKITTPINVKVFARYYTDQGDQIGIGPLPPQVGQTTKYWIFISLNDYLNDLENIIIKAELGENVSLTGKQSASAGQGLINSGQQITWQIDQARLITGEPTNIGVAAEVALTPEEKQLGTIATLLENISVSATDASTKALITKTSPNITTIPSFDQEKNNNGIITK